MPDIGFGLNPQVGDLNQDGWLDVYVCNDFRVPDFAYINNGDGTFREGRKAFFKHLSFNSMGGDIADVNNIEIARKRLTRLDKMVKTLNKRLKATTTELN